MLTYFAHQAYDGAWHVAYRRPLGGILSVLDCISEETARAEAERINEDSHRRAESVRRSSERRLATGWYTGQGDM